jgi:UDP-N-acetylglucosamine transferase subunit ALG13
VIFVTVGTNEAPFDRLVRWAADLGHGEDLLVQYGTSVASHGAHGLWTDFLSFEETAAAVEAARVVVSHAGVGSILLAHRVGKRPIVIPRLRSRREAVDDHQWLFARRLAEAGLVVVAPHQRQLKQIVANPPVFREATWEESTGNGLVTDLSERLALVAPTRALSGRSRAWS